MTTRRELLAGVGAAAVTAALPLPASSGTLRVVGYAPRNLLLAGGTTVGGLDANWGMWFAKMTESAPRYQAALITEDCAGPDDGAVVRFRD